MPLTPDVVYRIPEDIDPFPLPLERSPALPCKLLLVPSPVRVTGDMVKGLGMGHQAEDAAGRVTYPCDVSE